MVEISGDRIESTYQDSQGCPGECGASHMALKAKAEKERGSKRGPREGGCRGESSVQGTLLEGRCRSSVPSPGSRLGCVVVKQV